MVSDVNLSYLTIRIQALNSWRAVGRRHLSYGQAYSISANNLCYSGLFSAPREILERPKSNRNWLILLVESGQFERRTAREALLIKPFGFLLASVLMRASLPLIKALRDGSVNTRYLEGLAMVVTNGISEKSLGRGEPLKVCIVRWTGSDPSLGIESVGLHAAARNSKGAQRSPLSPDKV